MPESFTEVTPGSGLKLHTWTKTVGANTVHDEVVLQGIPYLPTFVVVGDTVSVATLASHLVAIQAGASLNVYVLRIEIYQATLATASATFYPQIVRLSTAGTGGTVITPAPLDSTDSASATARTLPGVKGTETTFLGRPTGTAMQSMTASVHWPPPLVIDYLSTLGKPLKIPAGTANGLAIKNGLAIAGASYNIMVSFIEASF